ncbi:Uncharacterized membrane protein YcaP, DUF421 family [Seinonella peptonophila]|uniref:Uncharacterized membrane protein YcaP, DUF421 family n=1 Tax=Seinonella peptonophila TaxID=112248 RepID=A0A1M4X4A6_9BACL|nr:DUF421 domain-containing protein [Seinonella peptonophila]SHE88022.1 Uncharacterized membrane protein YcaP, DUF421 family [Seinonella peptonophila]
MGGWFHVHFWEMTLRAVISFVVLLMLARILGKVQISQLTFFNYITGITIGSMAADIAAESQTPFLNGLISLIWWSILTILVGYISLKSTKGRILLDGQPSILIKQGVIMEDVLKANRLNLDDLSMLLREKSVFSLKDVDYAILEPDGKLSVLKKVTQQSVTKQDIQISSHSKYLPSEIISDRKIVEKNLKELGLDQSWVLRELRKQGIQSIDEVFYAEIQADGSLLIQKVANQ